MVGCCPPMCDVCDYMFAQEHRSRALEVAKKYPCPVCGVFAVQNAPGNETNARELAKVMRKSRNAIAKSSDIPDWKNLTQEERLSMFEAQLMSMADSRMPSSFSGDTQVSSVFVEDTDGGFQAQTDFVGCYHCMMSQNDRRHECKLCAENPPKPRLN